MLGVSTEGIIPVLIITLLNDSITDEDVGKPVKISANDTAMLCADGESFIGLVSRVSADGEVVAIKISGSVTIGYSGADITDGVGKNIVADGTGKVKTGSAASDGFNRYTVLKADSTAKTVTIILKNG